MTTDTIPLIPHAANQIPVPENILDAVEAQWIERVQTQRLPTKGKRYQNDEREFFVGAMSALIASNSTYFVPPRWALKLFCGRQIMDEGRFK